MGKESGYYKEILNKLEGLVKREYALIAALGIQGAVITGVSVWVSFSFIEMLWHFSSTVRTILFLLSFLISAGLLIAAFIVPVLKYFNVFRKTDYYKAAGKVGEYFPSIKDDLLNAMQLVADDEGKKYFSVNLIEAAFKNVFERTKNLNFKSVIDFKKAKQLLPYFSGILAAGLLLLAFVPGLNSASYRIINFNRDFTTPPKFVFKVFPGNYNLTKGDSLKIEVRVEGQQPKEVFMASKNSDETDFITQQLYADSTGSYYYYIPAVRTSFKYYAKAENINSDLYSIDVIDRPVIKTLDVAINSPAYSHIPKAEQQDNGNVSALTGSVVNLNLTSTKPLIKAWLEFGDTTKKELSVNSTGASGNFIVKKDDNYKIVVKDKNGNLNLSPIIYSVKALADAYPSIEIVSPNSNTSLANDNRLPVDVKIADDYGFTKLILCYRLSQSKYEPVQNDYKSLEIPINKNINQEEVQYVWNLTALNLTAEDVVTYYLEVFDNDIISGPKSTKSPSFSVRVPTLDEVLNKADQAQNKSVDNMEQTLKKAEELKQRMQEISQELKQDKKDITWQEKQKIEQTLNDFKQLQEKVSDVSKDLQKMQQDLQKNNMLSKETLEKYTELQNLFKEMSTDEMRKAMEQMQNILQNMDRKMTQDALENMKFNEDQFRKSIERTMNLLKRIQVEQKIDDLLKRTEQISKDQNEIQQQTKKSDASNNKDELSKKQNDLTKDAEDYSKQLHDLQKKFEELKDLPKDQLEKLSKEYEEQKNEQLSQKASEDIQQNQVSQAQQNQSQIMQNMQQMKKGMQQLQQSIARQNQLQTFTDMMKITDNLITLSKQQEQLENQTSKSDQSTTSGNENAQRQNGIQNNLDKIMQQLSKLSQKTFAITPEMGKALGDAERQMNQAIQNIQSRNKQAASNNQGQAMEGLNEAASLLKSSMEQMMQGGQGGGMPSLMQQLQKLSGQQMSLNNLTQMLQQAMKGSLSMQQQAQMQRLAQQQELIRKSLEQLNKEAQKAGESKKIPANLEDIARKMQEVVKNLSTDNVDEKVLQQQEHILSRLLEAQHSVNERDYEKQRESKAGENIAGKSPAELNLSADKDRNKIKDELDKAVQEGYSKDYENLIRKYFEALQKENNKK